MFSFKKQLKLISLCLALSIIQFGVLAYLPLLRLINLGLIATLFFSYFGKGKLHFLLPLLTLGFIFDALGSSFQWGFYGILFVFLFLSGHYFVNLFLRRRNLFSYLIFFSFFYLFFAAAIQIQNFLVFEQSFFDFELRNYILAYGVNLIPSIAFYYGDNYNLLSREEDN